MNMPPVNIRSAIPVASGLSCAPGKPSSCASAISSSQNLYRKKRINLGPSSTLILPLAAKKQFATPTNAAIPSRFIMKVILAVACFVFCFLFTIALTVHAAGEPQTFPTSAGPVTITPLYHASTLIEAGGKTIYVDPAKPAKLAGLPKADLILITDIHGDHMDPDWIKEVSKADTEILAPAAVVRTVTSAKPIANEETKSWQGWTIEAIPAYNLKRGPEPGNLFTTRDAAMATFSATAASAFTFLATPKAFRRCGRSRTSTWRSCA
jgi:hypothetical protein